MPLNISKLSKRFGNKWVLRDLSFDVADGRIFGICGASGSGKSTLLECIAGEIKDNGGSITVDGRDITALKPRERNVVLLSGADRPSVVRIITGKGADGPSGLHQRKSFEEALQGTEKVLLLDDPFSNMDVVTREECFDMLRDAAHGRVVIFATSHFGQLAAIADDAAILGSGEFTQIGTPQQIYDEPATVAAARLSGDNNLFQGRRLSSSNDFLPEFYTIEGGHRIFVHKPEKCRLGPIDQNMTLAIRPEQISMSMGASFPEDNLVKAVVTGIKPRGPTILIEFDANGLKLEARVFKVVGLNIGDECMLGLPPHRIRMLLD